MHCLLSKIVTAQPPSFGLLQGSEQIPLYYYNNNYFNIAYSLLSYNSGG